MKKKINDCLRLRKKVTLFFPCKLCFVFAFAAVTTLNFKTATRITAYKNQSLIRFTLLGTNRTNRLKKNFQHTLLRITFRSPKVILISVVDCTILTLRSSGYVEKKHRTACFFKVRTSPLRVLNRQSFEAMETNCNQKDTGGKCFFFKEKLSKNRPPTTKPAARKSSSAIVFSFHSRKEKKEKKKEKLRLWDFLHFSLAIQSLSKKSFRASKQTH